MERNGVMHVNTAIFPIGVKMNPERKVIRYGVTGAS